MRTRTTLLVAMLALAIAAVASSAASAATLYTTAAHTTAVPVNTTFTATTTAGTDSSSLDYWGYKIYQGPNLARICHTADLSFKVTQNSAGVLKASVIGNTFHSCSPFTITGLATGALQVSGSSITVGTAKAWTATTLTGITQWESYSTNVFTGSFTSATGNPPAHGVFAQQPAAAAPLTLAFNDAGTLSGPQYGNGRVTANYVFTGASASYSLG